MASKVGSTVLSSSSRKRKHLSFETINELVHSVGDEAEPEALKAMWQKLKGILEANQANLAGIPKRQKVEQVRYQ
jgi:hypothetical protein